MIFITTIIYQKIRENEILKCLDKNSKYNLIDKYIIFFEKTSGDELFLTRIKSLFDSNINKLDLQVVQSRPLIKSMIEYAEKNYSDNICLITNSDIMFYKGFEKLNKINYNKYNVALTRYNTLPHKATKFKYSGVTLNIDNYQLKSMLNSGRSTDTWVFKLPIKIKDFLDYPLGTFQGDSYLNKLLHNDKATINPIYDVISIHLHDYWNIRNYNNFKHSSRTYWKLKYKRNQKGIPFSKLEDKHCE